MRGSVLLAVVLSACIIPVAASSAATTSSGGKSASCTPKVQPTGKWGSWVATKPASSMLVSHRPAIKYPKNSGRIAVGGFCHVSKPGLGKRFVETRHKLAPKHVTPVTPPTTIVGNPPVTVTNPPVIITPPAPPVVVTPPAPPVTPPTAPTPVFTCDNLTVTGVTPGVTAQTAAFFTAVNGVVFKSGTTDWGDGSSSQTADYSDGQINGAHSYTVSGRYTITVTFAFTLLSDGSTVTATSSQCQRTVRVRVPVPTWRCTALVVSGLSTGSATAQVAAHFTATNGAVFDSAVFAWGDPVNSSNSTRESSFGEADYAFTYPGPGQYPIVATLYFRVPGTTDLQTATCSATATVL